MCRATGHLTDWCKNRQECLLPLCVTHPVTCSLTQNRQECLSPHCLIQAHAAANMVLLLTIQLSTCVSLRSIPESNQGAVPPNIHSRSKAAAQRVIGLHRCQLLHSKVRISQTRQYDRIPPKQKQQQWPTDWPAIWRTLDQCSAWYAGQNAAVH
jgi:hypothetical protein